jgi:hypothetical protein
MTSSEAMMPSPAVRAFEANLQLLDDVVAFDDKLMDFVVGPLENYRDRLIKAEIPARHLPNSLIQVFKNIRTNKSLRAYYQALYNQWLVLLVSYFGAAVKDLFIEAATTAIRERQRPEILKAVLEASIEEIADEHEDIPAFLADLLASKKDISFQDMQSIGRAFKEYFEIVGERDRAVNDIILAQACRHAIVHSGGTVDKRLLKQLRSATPRTLKNDLHVNERLEFSPAEIKTASEAMHTYLCRLDDGLRKASA